MNTCKKMFAAVLAAATMITSIGVSFAEETPINYIDQTVLDSDYNKTNITSSFAQCANTDFTQSGDDTTSNPTYNGISEDNVIKFDWQPTQVSENWHWFRVILGTKEQLKFDETNDTVTYYNYSDSSNTYTQSFRYDFANDTETIYNVYIDKTDGDLVFGIKKSFEEAYTGIKIADAVNDGYNCIRMRTFGFRVKVSNAYVYTKKVPMAEVAQSGLDSDYDVFDAKGYLFNNGSTYSGSETTSYEGLSNNSVVKITMRPGKSTADYMYVRLSLGANETITFNQTKDKITYKNTKTNVTKEIDYDFANDGTSDTVGTTEYNVYVSKIDNTLVFGIKKATETSYVWFSIDNAQSDNYTTLKFGTFGYLTGVSNAYVYTKKVPMPEVAQSVLDSDYDVYDAKDNLFNNGSTYSGSETTSYEGLSDNSVVKITMKPGKSTADYMYVRLSLGANETITFNQTKDKITYKNTKTNVTKEIDYDFANDGTSDTVGTTEYNVYVSKIDNTLVFGIKKATETSYVWFSIDNAQSDNYTTLKFGTFGYLTGVSHAYVYTKKNEMPLPTAEELAANYTLKKADSSVFAAVANVADGNEARNSATVSDVALKNYVTYLKAAFSDLGSYEGDGFVFDFGRDKVTFNIYNGGIKYNMEPENAIGYTFAANKVYDIAAAKTGSRFVFGIKSADEEKYTWFEKTSAENDNTDYLKATEYYIGANVSEFKLYTLKDYQYGNVETVTADKRLTSTFKITRTNQDAIDTGIFITAVYSKGEYPVMNSVAATEVKALTLESEVTFENTVSIPTDGEYEVKYFLWKNFSGLIPVVSNIK